MGILLSIWEFPQFFPWNSNQWYILHLQNWLSRSYVATNCISSVSFSKDVLYFVFKYSFQPPNAIARSLWFLTPSPYHCVLRRWLCPGRSCSARTHQNVPQTWWQEAGIVLGRSIQTSGGSADVVYKIWFTLLNKQHHWPLTIDPLRWTLC